MSKLEIFWDVACPYCYLLSTQLDAVRERSNMPIVLRPVSLEGIFNAAANTTAACPAKAKYVHADLRRWRELYDVPLRLPPVEKSQQLLDSRLPMRAAVAAERDGADEAFCVAILNAQWVQGLDVSLPGVVVGVAHEIGMDGDSLLSWSESAQVKDRLQANTEEAVRRGAFGTPSLFVGDELFWGNDRLAMVEQRLRELKSR